MTDVFLYSGEANPNDVVLADPTVPRGGVTPNVFTYAGQVDTLSGIGAAYCKGKAPAVSVNVVSTIVAAVAKGKAPAVIEVGATMVAAVVSKSKAPPTSIDVLSTVPAALAKVAVPGTIVAGQTTIAASVSKTKTPSPRIDGLTEFSAALAKGKVPSSSVDLASGVPATLAKGKAPAVAIAALSSVQAATSYRSGLPTSFDYLGQIDAVSDVTAITSAFRQLTEEEGRAVTQHFYTDVPNRRHPRPVIVPEPMVSVWHVFEPTTGIVVRPVRVEAASVGYRRPQTHAPVVRVQASRARVGAGVMMTKACYAELRRGAPAVTAAYGRTVCRTAETEIRAHVARLDTMTPPLDWQLRTEDLELLRLLELL